MMDADGQHPPEVIPTLIKDVGSYDMVVGARSKHSDTSIHRDLANRIYNSFASYISGRKIHDLTSGFRAVLTEVIRPYLYLLPNTFSYPSTITLALLRSGRSLLYVPFESKKRVGKSKIKLIQDGLRFLLIILRISGYYSPLKVFIPISIMMFALGFGYGLYKVIFLNTRYGPTSALLMTVSVVIFVVGLVSEQIAQLRYQWSEGLLDIAKSLMNKPFQSILFLSTGRTGTKFLASILRDTIPDADVFHEADECSRLINILSHMNGGWHYIPGFHGFSLEESCSVIFE